MRAMSAGSLSASSEERFPAREALPARRNRSGSSLGAEQSEDAQQDDHADHGQHHFGAGPLARARPGPGHPDERAARSSWRQGPTPVGNHPCRLVVDCQRAVPCSHVRRRGGPLRLGPGGPDGAAYEDTNRCSDHQMPDNGRIQSSDDQISSHHDDHDDKDAPGRTLRIRRLRQPHAHRDEDDRHDSGAEHHDGGVVSRCPTEHKACDQHHSEQRPNDALRRRCPLEQSAHRRARNSSRPPMTARTAPPAVPGRSWPPPKPPKPITIMATPSPSPRIPSRTFRLCLVRTSIPLPSASGSPAWMLPSTVLQPQTE